MRRAITATLAAGVLAGLLATASASGRVDAQGDAADAWPTFGDQERGKPPNGSAVLIIAQGSTPQECANLEREELAARRRGDWWRADQLQDEYQRECLEPGR